MEIALFEAKISDKFPGHTEEVLSLVRNEVGEPLGFRHVDYLDAWAAPPLPENLRDHLRISYVLLAAAVFAIDRVWDHQSKNGNDILYPPVLVLEATKILAQIEMDAQIPNVIVCFAKALSSFATAMNQELYARQASRPTFEGIEPHIINRSRLFVGLFEAICLLKRRLASEVEIKLLEGFIFWMQRGDDLGDWREDHKSGFNSSFLKKCFAEMMEDTPSEEELERHVYLSGAYENEARAIIIGFESVEEAIGKIQGAGGKHGFMAFVEKQRWAVERVLQDFDAVKARHFLST